MDWKKALKMVVGIPETAKGASKHGVAPVGVPTDVTLPAGEVKLSYAESIRPRHENDRMVFPEPPGLVVTVTPAGGGEPLVIRDPGRVMIGKSPGPVTWREIGTLDIAEPGTYRVEASVDLTDKTEPRILLG